jgi:Rad3-related DNA helicase
VLLEDGGAAQPCGVKREHAHEHAHAKAATAGAAAAEDSFWPPPGVRAPKKERLDDDGGGVGGAGADGGAGGGGGTAWPKKEEDGGGTAWLKKEEDGAAGGNAGAPPALFGAAVPFFPPPPFVPAPPPPPAVPRYGLGLGMHRRLRRAALSVDSPPHVRTWPPPPPGAHAHATQVHPQLSVSFPHPYKPQPPQVAVMECLGRALYASPPKHALVEAPTGTGKTMAIATTLLACQAQLGEQLGTHHPGGVPRVIMVSRTHAQLEHMARELRDLPYATCTSMPVSKERLCLQERKPGLSRAEQCRGLCKPLDSTVPFVTKCEFLDRMNQSDFVNRYIERYVSGGTVPGGGDLVAPEIEDMVAKSRAVGVCPFHVTRDMQLEGANVLLLTYNQLLDLHIRRCNGTDALLRGSSVLIDEAHNVPGVAREAATAHEDARTLYAMGEEAQRMEAALKKLLADLCAPRYRHEECRLLPAAVDCAIRVVGVLGRLSDFLLGWLRRETRAPRADVHAWDTDGLTQTARLSGHAAQELIAAALRGSGAYALAQPAQPQDAAPDAAPPPPPPPLCASDVLACLQDGMDSVYSSLTEAGYASSRASQDGLCTLLSKLQLCASQAQPEQYALVLQRLSSKGEDAERAKPSSQAPSPLPALSFTCLSAAVAMAPVRRLARCLVLASGTLGPPAQLACELGLPDESYEAVCTEHHATAQTNLLPIVVTGGSSGQELRVTAAAMKHNGVHLLRRLGAAVLAIVRHVPGGSLMFWPSMRLMMEALDEWHRCGLLPQLHAVLGGAHRVLVDGSESVGDSSETIETFRTLALNGRALLVAVMRGRASEGTDFKNAQARSVITVGLPLRPYKCPSVVSKQAYNDAHGPPLPTGEQWYTQDAVRLRSRPALACHASMRRAPPCACMPCQCAFLSVRLVTHRSWPPCRCAARRRPSAA